MAINRIQHRSSHSATTSQTPEESRPLLRSSSRASSESQSTLPGTPKHLSTRSSNGLAPRSMDISKLQGWKGKVTKGLKAVGKNAESLGKQMGQQMGNAAFQTGKALYNAADRLLSTDDVRHDPYAGYSQEALDAARYYNQEPREEETEKASERKPSIADQVFDMHRAAAARAERAPVMKWQPVDRQSEKEAADYYGVQPDYSKMVEVVDVQATAARDAKRKADAQAMMTAPPASAMPKEPKLHYRPADAEDRRMAQEEADQNHEYANIPDEVPDYVRYNREMAAYKEKLAAFQQPASNRSGLQKLDEVAQRMESRTSERPGSRARTIASSEGRRTESFAPPPQSVRTQSPASQAPSPRASAYAARPQTTGLRDSGTSARQRAEMRPNRYEARTESASSSARPPAATVPKGPEVVGERMGALLKQISPEKISANKDPSHFAALVAHLASGTPLQVRVDRLERLDLLGKRVMLQWAKFTALCNKTGADPAQLMRSHSHDVVAYLIGSDVNDRVETAANRMNRRAGG